MIPIDPNSSVLSPHPLSTSPATSSSPESTLPSPPLPPLPVAASLAISPHQGKYYVSSVVCNVTSAVISSSSPSLLPPIHSAPLPAPVDTVAFGKGLTDRNKTVDTTHVAIEIPPLKGAWA
ncbi:hypothetical protein AALP_AA8G147900 [Arabis alpina]|uniref:Uncharacterized protein n=1 Tax=Arabis alpina TaxID=50452 RepID=A0A087G750_ARAAL|nr:hypothetical protein AALP_AA8G147900 [Arabis alpina]